MNEQAFPTRSLESKTYMTYEKGRTRIRQVIALPNNCEAHVEFRHYSWFSVVDICITKQNMYIPALQVWLKDADHRQSCKSLADEYLRSPAFRELHSEFDELCIPRENERLFVASDERVAGGAV